MKKTWHAPKLEILSVEKTMASTTDGPLTDEAYVPGQNAPEKCYKRFTS
ncbi:paeninodin family lasso peptide [Bacillus carboniphilus]|uniref:Paeninodin family lasso peptide n=1 Tax=Bacillus carboniphilus TaxID=86663 RepID=A0ABY9JVK5_9BACI|nr:paeninodin family lasso peptide [Bacillus carboniphilus]WLR42773.1 paeninodin family lasso peptide [Bacillus carboniphilus]